MTHFDDSSFLYDKEGYNPSQNWLVPALRVAQLLQQGTCLGPQHELICGKGSLLVSETPKDLVVAIMDLYPSILKQ
jgi:hypothetical protein